MKNSNTNPKTNFGKVRRKKGWRDTWERMLLLFVPIVIVAAVATFALDGYDTEYGIHGYDYGYVGDAPYEQYYSYPHSGSYNNYHDLDSYSEHYYIEYDSSYIGDAPGYSYYYPNNDSNLWDNYYKPHNHGGYIGITPFSTGLNVTIASEGQTVDFSNPGHPPFVMDIIPSYTLPQLVTINAQFTNSMTTTRTVEISLPNGMAFHSAPGMVPNQATRPDNWTFNASTLIDPFPGEIIGGTYAQNPLIVQSISGNQYQPRAGTITYTLAPGVTSISIPVTVTVDQAFLLYAGDPATNTRFLSDAINVTVAETSQPTVTATLDRYQINGNPDLRWVRTPHDRIMTYGLGDGSRWTTSHGFTSGVNPSQLLHDEITFTMRVPKAITDASELSVTRTGLPSMNDNMFSYVIDSATNASYHLITITMTQANISIGGEGNFFTISGMIPDGAVPGTYTVAALHSTNSNPSPNQGMNVTSLIPFGAGQLITVIDPNYVGLHALLVLPMTQGNRFSGIQGVSPLMPLGGFLVRNQSSSPLANQAIQVTFPTESLELIGVRGFRLPAGVQGIQNIRVTTITHQTNPDGSIAIDANGHAIINPGGGRTIDLNGPFSANGTRYGFPFVTLNLDDMLDDNEFISVLYYEMAGDIPPDVMWGLGNTWTEPNRLAFFYFGRVLNPDGIASGTHVSAHAISGPIDSTNPDGTGINAVHRYSATTNMYVLGPRSISLALTTSANVNNQTIVAGNTIQNVQLTLPRIHHQYLPVVFGVQGFFIYLRSPANIFNVERDSIVATWAGNTYSEALGNLEIDVLTDSTGSKVYRLRLTEPIYEFVIEGIPPYLAAQSNIGVSLSITALPSAPPISIPLRYLFFASTIREDITFVRGNFHAYEMTDPFHIGSGRNDNRTNPGQYVVARPGGSGAFNDILSVQSEGGVRVSTHARQITGGVPGAWINYDWDTGNYIADLSRNGDIELMVEVHNNAANDATEFYVLVPIPRKDQWIVSQADALADNVQQEPFEWSMVLAGMPVVPPGYEILVSTSYALRYANAVFHPWSAVSGGIIDIEDVLTVMIRAVEPIPSFGNPGFNPQFIIPLDVCPDVDLIADAGAVNRFSSMVYRVVPAPTNLHGYRESLPVALRLNLDAHPWDVLRAAVNASPASPATPYRIYINDVVGGWGACGAQNPNAIVIPADRRVELVSESGNTGAAGSLERVLWQPTANQRHFTVLGELELGEGVTLCGTPPLQMCDHPIWCGEPTPVSAEAFDARIRGGVAVDGGQLTMHGGSIIQNNRASDGGGVFVGLNGSFLMTGGIISGNTATYNGGGVIVHGTNSNFNMRMPTTGEPGFGDASHPSPLINNNTANANGSGILDGGGGGIYVALAGTLTANNARITNNTATNGMGGGIFTENYEYYNVLTLSPAPYPRFSNINLTNVTFNGNTAMGGYNPPVNALSVIPDTAFQSTSLLNHPLNNFDINMWNTGYPFILPLTGSIGAGVFNIAGFAVLGAAALAVSVVVIKRNKVKRK